MALRSVAIAALAVSLRSTALSRAPVRRIAGGRSLLSRDRGGGGGGAFASWDRRAPRAFSDDRRRGYDDGDRYGGSRGDRDDWDRFDGPRRGGSRDRFDGFSQGGGSRDRFDDFSRGGGSRDRFDGPSRNGGSRDRFDRFSGGDRDRSWDRRRAVSGGRGEGRGDRRSGGTSASRRSSGRLRPSEVVPKDAEVLFGVNSVLAALESGGRKGYALYVASETPDARRSRDEPRSANDERWAKWASGDASSSPRAVYLTGISASSSSSTLDGSSSATSSHPFMSLSAYPSRTDKQLATLTRRALGRAVELARLSSLPVVSASRQDLAALATEGSHQGLALVCSRLEPLELARLPSPGSLAADLSGSDPSGASSPSSTRHPALYVALDEIKDPRNLGAIVRCATVLGADETLVCSRNCAPLSSAASRASAGALERAPPKTIGSLPQALAAAREAGWRIVGADAGPGAKPASAVAATLSGPTLLVLGSEGDGLRPLVRNLCDDLIKVDQSDSPAAQAVGSLNVSVAAGILIRELRAALDRNARDPTVPEWVRPEAAIVGEAEDTKSDATAANKNTIEEVWSVETGQTGLERIERFVRDLDESEEEEERRQEMMAENAQKQHTQLEQQMQKEQQNDTLSGVDLTEAVTTATQASPESAPSAAAPASPPAAPSTPATPVAPITPPPATPAAPATTSVPATSATSASAPAPATPSAPAASTQASPAAPSGTASPATPAAPAAAASAAAPPAATP